MTKKIAFCCSGRSSQQSLTRFARLTPGSSGVWNDIVGTDDPSHADYFVIMGNQSLKHFQCGNQYIDPQRAIQFRREPDVIQKFVSSKAKYQIDYAGEGYHAAVWFIEKPFEVLANMAYPQKNKRASAISSAKHQHRNRFLRSVYDADSRELIDFFGRGLGTILGDRKDRSNYKGQFNYNKNCKFNGLYDYAYSIAVENSSQQNYFTEKIADCFLSWTMPLYWGCPNISDYFPEHSYYQLDLDRPEDIAEIITRPIEKKHIDAMREARELVLYKYNLWPTIEKVLNEH